MTLAPTRGGAQALIRDFAFSEALPFTLEFTAGHMRVFQGLSLVMEDPHAVLSISTATPAVVQTSVAHGYFTGDQVQLSLTWLLTGQPPAGMLPVIGKQWAITVVDTTHFSLTDAITGTELDGSTLALDGWGITAARIVDFTTPYTLAEIQANSIRVIQDQDIAIICDGMHQPMVFANNAGNTLLQVADAVTSLTPGIDVQMVELNYPPTWNPGC